MKAKTTSKPGAAAGVARIRVSYVNMKCVKAEDMDLTVSVRPEDQFTVAANLAYKWYDEIESGKKKIEYRDLTDYWQSHIFKTVTDENGEEDDIPAVRIKFTRGYTKRNMTWTITRIECDPLEGQFRIHLGKRVE